MKNKTTVELISEAFINKTDMSMALGLTPKKFAQAETMAHKLYSRGKFAQAQVILQGLISTNKKRDYPYVLMGDIAFQSALYSDALEYWKKADEYKPNQPWTNLKLAEAYIQLGHIKPATKALDVVLANNDKNTVLLRQRAAALKSALENWKKS